MHKSEFKRLTAQRLSVVFEILQFRNILKNLFSLYSSFSVSLSFSQILCGFLCWCFQIWQTWLLSICFFWLTFTDFIRFFLHPWYRDSSLTYVSDIFKKPFLVANVTICISTEYPCRKKKIKAIIGKMF